MWFAEFIVIIALCVAATAIDFRFTKIQKLIIDTDAGGDDAAAILLALEAQKRFPEYGFEIVAITCTYGNTDVDSVATNVLKILTIANRSDIPVYVGARKPLLRHFAKENYFGEDGFGDFPFDMEIIAALDKSQHASLAMANIVRANPGTVSILAIGPLTNIALATTLDRNFIENVNRFYVLGSAVRGKGNVGPNLEFNFSQDPHSNFIVLNGTEVQPTFLFPWEVNLDAAVPMDWRKNILGNVTSRSMQYLNKIEKTALARPIWHVSDLGLAAVALWPELVGSSVLTNVMPVIDGGAAGSVLVDYAGVTGQPVNVEILESFDIAKFKELLLEMFTDHSQPTTNPA